MSGPVEFCAGFPSDLVAAIAGCPPDGQLADFVAFHDVFEGVDREAVGELFATAGASDPWTGGPLREADGFWLLPAGCVATLARIDDLALGGLRRAWWARLGHEGEPPADLGQAVRGLVVQCRAALANGWVVAWRERTCDDPDRR